MDKGLYTLEDGELVPEPVLSETPAPATSPTKSSCPQVRFKFKSGLNFFFGVGMY